MIFASALILLCLWFMTSQSMYGPSIKHTQVYFLIIPSVIMIPWSLLIAIFVSFLLFFHFFLCLRFQTTNEYFRGIYPYGENHHMISLMGQVCHVMFFHVTKFASNSEDDNFDKVPSAGHEVCENEMKNVSENDVFGSSEYDKRIANLYTRDESLNDVGVHFASLIECFVPRSSLLLPMACKSDNYDEMLEKQLIQVASSKIERHFLSRK